MRSSSWNKSKKADQRSSSNENSSQSKSSFRTTWFFWAGIGLFFVAVLSYLTWRYLESKYVMTTGRVIRPTSEIRATTEGKIDALHVSEGEFVEKDQLLFTLGSGKLQSKIKEQKTDYQIAREELQALQNTEVDPKLQQKVASARQKFRKIKFRLERKKLKLKRFKRKRGDLNKKIKNLEKLYMMEIVSRNEFRDMQFDFEEVKLKQKELHSVINQLKSELKNERKTKKQMEKLISREKKKRTQKINRKKAAVSKKRERLKELRELLDQLNIRAPRDGVVLNIKRRERASVSKNEHVLSVGSNDKQWIRSHVPAQKFSLLNHGDKAVVRIVGSGEKTYRGIVDLNSSTHGPAQQAQAGYQMENSPYDLENKTIPIRVNLNKKNKKLRSGMVVRVRIPLTTSSKGATKSNDKAN